MSHELYPQKKQRISTALHDRIFWFLTKNGLIKSCSFFEDPSVY
jgi:hypothetical protein